jgi:hypothetical protein
MEAWVKKREGAEFRTETPLFSATLAEGSFAIEIMSPARAALEEFAGDLTVVDSLGKPQTVSAGQRVELGDKTGASTAAPLPAGVAKPEEPSLEGPAKPVSQAPAVKKRAARAKPASPVQVPAEAKPQKASPTAPAIDSKL